MSPERQTMLIMVLPMGFVVIVAIVQIWLLRRGVIAFERLARAEERRAGAAERAAGLPEPSRPA